jgi:hypothetical protein
MLQIKHMLLTHIALNIEVDEAHIQVVPTGRSLYSTNSTFLSRCPELVSKHDVFCFVL